MINIFGSTFRGTETAVFSGLQPDKLVLCLTVVVIPLDNKLSVNSVGITGPLEAGGVVVIATGLFPALAVSQKQKYLTLSLSVVNRLSTS